ncbi:hypothetical protein NC653_003961 [Populus alba x Populus x berolinensis]|uniref:Uncharacterized protein n=1 Tax=Populus alba x Populus x berolinensis TaxID=444605 RepID=A0AAD6RUT9_9ROSI|nr:hypothetical protein NC653_003961 [Populus alba x Populus x berolinensis]
MARWTIRPSRTSYKRRSSRVWDLTAFERTEREYPSCRSCSVAGIQQPPRFLPLILASSCMEEMRESSISPGLELNNGAASSIGVKLSKFTNLEDHLCGSPMLISKLKMALIKLFIQNPSSVVAEETIANLED